MWEFGSESEPRAPNEHTSAATCRLARAARRPWARTALARGFRTDNRNGRAYSETTRAVGSTGRPGRSRFGRAANRYPVCVNSPASTENLLFTAQFNSIPGSQDRLAGEDFHAAALGTFHRGTPNTVLRVISLVRLSQAAPHRLAHTCPFSVLSYSCSLGPKYWTIGEFSIRTIGRGKWTSERDSFC